MAQMTCNHCGKSSSPADAGSNWNHLGSRDGNPFYECDCGHGLILTGGCLGLLFGGGREYVEPKIVEHQKTQMRNAGIDPAKLPTPGDMQKAMNDAPPGDTSMQVGDRVIQPVRGIGTVTEVIKSEDGSLRLRIVFDADPDDRGIWDPIKGKIRKA